MTPDEHRTKGLELLAEADRRAGEAAARRHAAATAHLLAAGLPAQSAGRHHQDALCADIENERDELAVENEQLRYERHLLGVARMTLDLVAAGGPERWDEVRRQAEDVAQRIVDEIGHPVTDEPALGPSMRDRLATLDSAMHSVYLHVKWRWLTTQMTTAEKEAAADAVDRHNATYPPDDRGSPVERWWRDDFVEASQ